MMGTMTTEPVPPFERFYLTHRDEVLGYLRRLLGQRAEDAWQETFLRALRSYDRLQHGRHLRAWVFTIATNVAMDELRA
jgi:DNA-directed RNA polymerase specialized sigma24 family protein